jgi:site-specific recombinase XerD
VNKTIQNDQHFVSANEHAKSEMVKRLARMAREERLNYDDFNYVCKHARKELGLRRPPRGKTLPKVLSDTDLGRFFAAIQAAQNIEHEIMLKFLLFTSVRVSELVSIKVGDIDLGACKVFINQGKGSKDRYILFPASFRLILASHLQANPKNRYLFESSQCRPYSPRRIQQIVQEYRAMAGIEQRVHPHLFRHQMLTALTRSGLSDAQIQLISGHASKQSLEVYQHIGLESVADAYQTAAAAAELKLSGRAA